MPTINVGNLENQEKILDYLTRIYSSIFDVSTVDWNALFAARRDGKIWATKFYSLDVSDTIYGERMNDSVDMECEPSTETVEGQDDFASFNAFWTMDCNFVVNDDGSKTITAIEGQEAFSRTGAVDVGVLTPPLYYGIVQVDDGEVWYLSDTPNDDLGLVLMPHCRDNAGNEMGFGLVTKYCGGLVDSVMYSSSGLPLKNFVSYNTLHTYMTAKGSGYIGAGSETTIYLITMLRIKYAVSSSQAYFSGNTSHDLQYTVSADTEDQTYVVVTTTQAANFYVGDCVSIGAASSSGSVDRSTSTMYGIVQAAQISSIVEDATDSTYSLIYLDVDDTFSTTADETYISTWPLWSGQTDNILGRDGYIATGSKYSFRLQGVEDGVGSNLISCNELWDVENDGEALTITLYNRNWGDYANTLDGIQSDWKECGTFDLTDYSSLTSTSQQTQWIGEISVDLETGSNIISSVGSGSSSGCGDYLYYYASNTGVRENITRGNLGDGSHAGLAKASANPAPSYSSWSCAGRIH